MQRARGKRKRLQDPARHGYRDLLDRAGIDGHLLDASNRNSTNKLGGVGEERHASEDESAAVAAAVGIKLERAAKGSPLVRVESAQTDATSPDSELGESEGVRLMKSPEMQNLDSPELSGESAFGDDDAEGPSSPEELRGPSLIIRRPTGEPESEVGILGAGGTKEQRTGGVSPSDEPKVDADAAPASTSGVKVDENSKPS
jgi:hypothetical protein